MFDGTGCEIRMGRTACESRDVPRMSSPAGSAANTSRTLSATFFCQPAPTIRQYRTLVHRGWLIVHGAKLAACLAESAKNIGAPARVIVGVVLLGLGQVLDRLLAEPSEENGSDGQPQA